MKRSTFFSILLIAVVAIGSSGCKKKPTGITHIPGRNEPAIRGDRPSGLPDGNSLIYSEPDAFPVDGSFPLSNDPMNTGPQERSILQAETVYFDVDSSIIKSSEQSKLQRVADYLAANPTHDVLIEGHCDERGTEGYNQSLGERRALAAREYLSTIGAPVNRVYTTSYGESRPAAQGSGESAWSQNRRGEFVVVLPAQ